MSLAEFACFFLGKGKNSVSVFRNTSPFFFHLTFFKAKVGSLSLVSSHKNFIITFQHIVIQEVWKNTSLILALYSDRDGTWANQNNFSAKKCKLNQKREGRV